MNTRDESEVEQTYSLNNPRFLLYGFITQIALVAGLISLVLHCFSHPINPVVILCQAMPSLLTIGLMAHQIYIMCSGRHNKINYGNTCTILGLNLILSTASLVAPPEHGRDPKVLATQIVSLVGYSLSTALYVMTVKGCKSSASRANHVLAPALGGFVPFFHTLPPTYTEVTKVEVANSMPPSYSQVCLVEADETHSVSITGTKPPPPYTLEEQ